jgi:hypothetical protein
MRRRSLLPHLITGFSVLLLILIGLPITPLAGESVFNQKDLSLTLPDGWTTQEIPSNFEKEVIAWFKSEKLAGTSIMVFLYKGWRYNYSSVRIGALKTIAASYPKGQEMLKKPEKIKTDKGSTAVIEFWRGAVDASGQTVFLETPMGILETKAGWLLMLGFAPSASGPQLEEDFLKIIKSAN